RVGLDRVGDVPLARSSIKQATGVTPVAVQGHPDQLDVTVDTGERVLPELLRRLDAAGVRVVTTTLRLPTLDDVFLALTGRSLREEGTTAADAVPEEEAGRIGANPSPPQSLAEDTTAGRSPR
ncbi:MAG: DUF4162 domain-containing protein, partial [Glaciihabitans sp.]